MAHIAALAGGGGLLGWLAGCAGNNAVGQLGDNTTASPRTSPTVVSGSHSFAQISAGYRNTCGVRTDGTALCWGK